MKELFILNPETYLVELDKTWISTVKEFKKLIIRDKGSEGDADGRKKLRATREFTFIYHYVDFRSEFSNYIGKDKLRACLRNADLPEDLDIERDDDLKAAITIYADLRMTKGLKIVQAGLKAIDAVAEFYNNAVVRTGKDAKELTASIKDLSGVINTTKELEAQLMKEFQDETGIRGNKEKGLDEDP